MAVCLVLALNFLTFPALGQGGVNPVRVDLTELPKGMSYTGKVKAAFRWQDQSGDNIAFISETGEFKHKLAKGDDRDATLEAGAYLLKNGSAERTWKMYEFVKACPVDIRAKFFENAFQVTDLNHDGIAEVWVMYKRACSGDVSPAEMKIIMYEGKKKHAVRGRNRVQISPSRYEGGDYTFDSTFLNGPKEFREYAMELWKKNLNEDWK